MNVTEMETDAPGEAWRTTSGAEPGAVKAASPVLNGEDEETGRKALRLVLTQHKMRGFSLHCGLVRGTYQASHFILRFLRVITNVYFVRAKRSSARNFSKSPKKPDTSRWVEAFVATWRYLKYDLIADMGDILDRGQRMERTTTTTIEERVEMLPDQQMHHRTELNRRARTFLNDQLAGGPQLCRLIRQQAAKQGISLSMLLVAKRSLHVQSRTVNEQVIWQLPAAA